jgi:acyl-CoA synthetase (AMP-forming)/AMP-acid ligase II
MADNLGILLSQVCAEFGCSTAVQDATGTLNYASLAQSAAISTKALVDRGVTRHEPVLVAVGNEGHDIASFMGVWHAGGVVVPLARQAPDAVKEGLRSATGARFMVNANGVAQVGDQPPTARAVLANAAFIVFTSGSTGRPKGVVLSHHRFAGKLRAIDSVLHFSHGTRALLVLQLSFVFGIWVTLLTLLKGGTVVMHPRFGALNTLEALRGSRFSDAAFVPTMLRKLLAIMSPQSLDEIALGRILTGGEPLGRELNGQLKSALPATKLVDVYGLTETASSDFFLTEELRETAPGTLGQPCPGVRFRIVDAQGGAVPSNTVGELQIRTPFIMEGYLDDPELTRSAFDGDFFRTGDLAFLRNDGIVELAGRAKDLIVRGGAKISPLEVDNLLAQHPRIAAALTVGVPDPVLGERIHVLVVPREHANLSEVELRAWISDRVERFKVPDAIHFGSELPTGANGKVDRSALRNVIAAQAGTRGYGADQQREDQT